MTTPAETLYGVPVNLTLGNGVFVDMGAECRQGRPVVILALDDGEGGALLEMNEEEAQLLADVLRGLASAAVQLRGGDGRPTSKSTAATQIPTHKAAGKDHE